MCKCLLHLACALFLRVTAHIGMAGRGEVVELVSLFCINVRKPYKQTKWPMRLKLFQVLEYRYCATLQKSRKAIKGKRPGRLSTGVRPLHDVTRPHTSTQSAARLQKRKWAVLQCPPHSPDLAPSDFCLLGQFKNFLSPKKLRTKTHCKDFAKGTLT